MVTFRYHTHPKFLPHPAKHISLRGGAEEEYTVVDVSNVGKPGGTAKILEQMETSRALFELYEGAVVCIPVNSHRHQEAHSVAGRYSSYIKESHLL